MSDGLLDPIRRPPDRRCPIRALVTVPYVHPHVIAVAGLLRALAAAAGRGADARLLLGGVPDPADLAAVRGLGLAARVMDPARSTTGHAKGAVLDGAAIGPLEQRRHRPELRLRPIEALDPRPARLVEHPPRPAVRLADPDRALRP